MLKAKNKKLSLLIAVVFAFTVLVPAGAVFADTEIDGTYKNVTTGDEVYAGSVDIEEDTVDDATYTMNVTMQLPDGVEFEEETDEVEDEFDNFVGYNGSNSSDFKIAPINIKSDSIEFEVKYDGGNSFSNDFEKITVDFGVEEVSWLSIDDDFAGNLDVDVEVLELDNNENIVDTESASVTIAKVAGDDVSVVVDDPEKISAGGSKDAADISLEESTGGAFSDEEEITLEIETDGVEFEEITIDTTRLGLDVKDSGISVGVDSSEKLKDVDGDFADTEELSLEINDTSNNLAGSIDFEDIKLSVDPDVTGDIEISITSNGDADLDETLTVATVGESELTVSADEDTGMEEYMRKASIDELWELTLETDKEFEKGDTIYITLPDGFEFYEKAAEVFNISNDADYGGLYNDEQSMWLEVSGDGKDEIELSSIYVAALPDCEYGDINVEISGDVGEAEVQAGYVKPAVKVDAEQTQVATRGYDQPAGDITFVETDKDAIEDGMQLHLVLPHDIEFSSKPTVTVNGEEIDGAKVGPDGYDDDVLQIEVDNARNNKVDTLVLSDIKYDIATSLLEGEVISLELGGNDPEDRDNFNLLYESYLEFKDYDTWKNFQFRDEADDVIAEVPNAVVVDEDTVTASFTLGDEGVTVKNGRTLVQVNQLGDILDLQKSWDAENKVAYFVKSGTTVQFPIDENKIIINGNEMPVDQGGVIENEFTYATLRGIQMAFGGELDWDDETKTATFKFKK